jgi:hypothetical protein
MRFVVNRRDEVSFLRMVSLLPGVGPGTAAKLWNDWLKTGLAGNENPPASWSDILLGFKVPKKSARHWEQLCYTLDELTPDGRFATPSAMIFSILEGVYQDYLTASFENADSRQSDLEKLSEYAGNFTDILDFLPQLSLMSSTDDQPSASSSSNRDPQSTIHDPIHLSSLRVPGVSTLFERPTSNFERKRGAPKVAGTTCSRTPQPRKTPARSSLPLLTDHCSLGTSLTLPNHPPRNHSATLIR